MKEVTSPARRKWSFPIPVDVHCQRSDEQKDENDERPATLQSTKLWPRLPAHKSYCGAIAVARPRLGARSGELGARSKEESLVTRKGNYPVFLPRLPRICRERL